MLSILFSSVAGYLLSLNIDYRIVQYKFYITRYIYMILRNKSKLNIEHRIPKSDKISKSWNDLDIKKNRQTNIIFFFRSLKRELVVRLY